MHQAAQIFTSHAIGANSARLNHPAAHSVKGQPAPVTVVGELRHGSSLSDDEREAAIARAGRAIKKHMATGNRADAGRAIRLMGALIAGPAAEDVRA